MKKLALLSLFLLLLTSCTKGDPIRVQMKINNTSETVNIHMNVLEYEYNGHDYIMFSRYGNSSAVGVVHNPNCHCKEVE